MKTYRVGDIYENWGDLSPCVKAGRPKNVATGDLFVLIDSGNRGKVVRFCRDDGSALPYFDDGSQEFAKYFTGLAHLPTEEVPNKIDKPYKIKVNPEQSEAVQKTCFMHGFGWTNDKAGKVDKTDKKHLFIDGIITFMYGDTVGDEKYFADNKNTEISAEDFIERFGTGKKISVKKKPLVLMSSRLLTVDDSN